MQHGENGIDGVALSMPVIIGRGGVEGSVPIGDLVSRKKRHY